jgi:predicted enzyme involved in methoxymalonyl-ACP biosynthesis
MGRKVEETMVHLAVARAGLRGARKVDARLLPTAKNQPCAEFWKRSGFSEVSQNLFSWSGGEYALPEAVSIEAEP